MSDFARRGLGRGLSALLGETPPRSGGGQDTLTAPQPAPFNATVIQPEHFRAPEPAPAEAPPAQSAGQGGVRVLTIATIQRNPSQPRKYFDETELSALADSIRAHGVLQPILVKPVRGVEGRFEIIAGERRWRASQIAGLSEIPALVRQAVDEVETLEIAIIENVQRADLNPLEEAQGYQSLIERFGRTQQDVADIVGKSRSHIANLLRLLALPDDIQDMVRDGRLSAGHARAILTAADPLALAKKAVAEGLNVREVERLAAEGKADSSPAKAAKAKIEIDPDVKALAEKLGESLRLGVSINPKGEGAGELRIAYKSLRELDDLCRRLSR